MKTGNLPIKKRRGDLFGDGCFFTIFIPAYNRAAVLEETLDSVQQSTNRDFEVIIVDDGSTDNTGEIAGRWRNEADFVIQYIPQENRGKMQAHNAAVSRARGYFFLTLDAGDLLLPEALDLLKNAWEKIPPEEKDGLAGIGAACLKEDGSIAGGLYPADGIRANYFEMLGVTGEKRYAIRTSVMKQYPYPGIEGEKHVRIDLILKRMAHKYEFWFTNLPVQVNRREADGITANIKNLRMNNPKGFRLFFLEEITLNRKYYGPGKQYGDHWRYVRYSLLSGIGLKDQSREVESRFFWLISIPQGTFKWLIDRRFFLTGEVS